ncbi:MAG: ABC transporter ATP-binding protein [Gemmatimonadetes bacterium]|nr:ABC transporter ATP-binding protein [Gemmatimonadota bacterium]
MRALLRLLPYYRPYRLQVAFGLLSVMISVTLYNTIPTFLRRAIDGLRDGAPTTAIVRIAGTMVAVSLVTVVFRYLMRELLNGVSRHIENDLRDDLFVHLTRLDAPWYARTRTGEIMARLTNDLGAVRMAAGPAIMYLTNTIFGGVMAFTYMLRISPRLTLLAVMPMIALPLVMLRLGRAIHERFEAVQAHFGDLTTLAQENLSGVRIVRAYRQEGAEAARFGDMSAEYVRRNMRLARLYGVMNPAFTVLAGLGAAAVLGIGGSMVVRGAMSVGGFVAFGFYLSNLTWPLIALGWVTNLFQRGAASMGRLNELFDAKAEVVSPATPVTLPATSGGRAIEFRHVSFAYPTKDDTPGRTVLDDVSFAIPAGSTLGVVGATGSGKTTLLELLTRVFDPTAGEVLVDGVPLTALDLGALRAEIGFVPQESLLFSETIGANLAYGELGAPAPAAPAAAAGHREAPSTGDDVRWAAGVAQLVETIEALPAGYDTVLGERGINLSGGQKQRAAMARALARRPAIVVFDDALSAVDTQTEAAILRGLREALATRTAVIASHRVTAIRDATHIIVLDDGRIVEQGTHETLLALRGRYWTLLNRQQLEEAVEAA